MDLKEVLTIALAGAEPFDAAALAEGAPARFEVEREALGALVTLLGILGEELVDDGG